MATLSRFCLVAAPGRRVATLDSATARRICAAPDSVLAERAPCVLRNQAPPLRVFWARRVLPLAAHLHHVGPTVEEVRECGRLRSAGSR